MYKKDWTENQGFCTKLLKSLNCAIIMPDLKEHCLTLTIIM